MSSENPQKQLKDPESWGDAERYFISSGKQIHFQKIPSPNYRIAPISESRNPKGSLYQLHCSSSDDPVSSNTTWDVYSNLPLYAARYESPLVSGNDSKTIYWEFETLGMGYEGTNAAFGIGWLVKDDGATTIKDKSLRPSDLAAAPISHSGPSVFWWSTDGGVYVNGKKLDGIKPVTANVGDIIGIGVTFEFDPESKVPSRDVNSNPSKKPTIVSNYLDRKGNKTTRVADAKDLLPCPNEAFITINGEAIELGKNVASDFINGKTDVYPVLLVSGPGIAGKIRIGEAVKFTGDGGVEDAMIAGEGNAGKAGFKKSKFVKWFVVPGHAWYTPGGAGGSGG